MKTARVSMVILLLACFLLPTAARAEWPERFVEIVVVGGAGGSGDVLARVLADHLSTALKQQFVVENRVGAGGIIGAQAIASATPDGYTLGVSLLSTISLAPVMNSAVAYDPLNDFTHIAYIAGAPVVLSASVNTGVRTLQDAANYAKQKQFAYSTAGVGTDGHLVGELIARAINVKSEHVPYKSAAQAIGDTVAGHVPFGTLTLGSTSPFMRSNQVNGVAFSGPARLADYPDLPTFIELGHREVTATSWYVLSGPPRIPSAIVDRLNHEVRAIMDKPEIRSRMQRDGFLAQQMSPAEVTSFIANENTRWRSLIEAIGLERKRN